MLTRLRVVSFSFLVICIILTSTTMASAVAPPGPPGGGQKYYVNGYVKSSSGVPISGAVVALFIGRIDVNAVTTGSNGYFSCSTYQLEPPHSWKAVVSKAGYVTATKTVTADPDGTTSMGTIYLMPLVPPPQNPDIVITKSDWRNWDFTLEWSIFWGTIVPSTSYSVDLYWSEDNDFTGDTPIHSWSTHDPSYTFTIQAPNRGEWWYRVYAKAANSQGLGDDEETGCAMGIVLPLADAYTDEDHPDTNYGDALELHAGESSYSGQTIAFLKFQVPNHAEVASASLFLRKNGVPYATHDAVAAYSVSLSWSEMWLTWNEQPAILEDNCIDFDPYGFEDYWDSWDITKTAQIWDFFAVAVTHVGEEELMYPVVYVSREGEINSRPHLLVQYRVDSKELAYDTKGLPQDVAVSDFFDEEQLNTDTWDAMCNMNPPIPYLIGDGYLGITGSSGYPYESDEGWRFGQDVYYPRGFMFETICGFLHQSDRAKDMYLGLNLWANDDTSQGAPFCYFNLHYRKGYYGPLGLFVYQLLLEGAINGFPQTHLLVSSPMYVQTMFPTKLTVVRDPNDGLIRLIGDSGENPIELLALYCMFPVERVELELRYGEVSEPSDTIGWIGWFNEIPLQTIENPSYGAGSNVLEYPLLAASFEDYSNVTANWFDDLPAYGSVVDDVGIHPYDPNPSFKPSSWYVNADSHLNTWRMVQGLEDHAYYGKVLFKFDTLKNQIVGFSVLARASSTTSFLRVEIGYQVAGEWYEACGKWEVLNPGDESWVELSVSTQYALPESLTDFEVRIVGIGYKGGYFSAYIDNARLEYISTKSNECKYGRLDIMAPVYSSTYDDVAEDIQIRSQPLLVATAKEGYKIGNIRMDLLSLIGTPSGVTNDLQLLSGNQYEANNIGAGYQTPEDYQKMLDTISAIRFLLKWGIRIGTALIDAPVGPIGWVISDVVDGLFQVLLAGKRTPVGITYDDIHYQSFPDSAIVGGISEWNLGVAGHFRPPIMIVQYSVDWSDSNNMYVGTSVISLGLACHVFI